MQIASPLPATGSIPAPNDTKRDRLPLLRALTILALIGFAVGVGLALFYAGPDATQGNVQRIFYFHVAAFVGASVSFLTGFIGGVAYLRTRKARWDTLSLAGIEVGFTLSLITLVTGMVWARPTWNTWWTWDPRLTSAAIMVLTYAAYFMLRNSIENPERQRALSAAYGMLAITTVIITTMITRVRPDTIHPTVIGPSPANAQGTFEMAANMGATLGINVLIWAVLIAPVLIWWRIRLENLFQRIEQLRAELI
ncbi:MAG: cytochrome c biogenesis protein CcsA [Aggregatilineales bacterium]